MNKLIKHKVIFLTIFMFFSTQSMAGNRILPVPKPLVDQEIKKNIATKKNIYPQKKPIKKVKKKTPEANQNTQ
jgi:hypothetical protein